MKIVNFINDPNAAIDKNIWFSFDRLSYETGSSNLTAESKAQIDNIVAILNAYPAVQIKIGGYTDNVGDPQANLDLSGVRATRVMEAIVAAGIAADRVEAEGYGDQYPIADNATEEGRAQNRRTAVSVRAK
jgi:outer membrane protein OmpA-like peptidoglycan-associated protein